MAAALASGSAGGHSYYGSLNFLDSQAVFDLVFPHPIPTLIVASSTSSSVDSNSVRDVITTFANQCKFQLFVPIFWTDYVGTADRNDSASLQATVHALKKLAMSSRHPTSGQWINLTPDDLFAEYSVLTPLLPTNVSLWGLNLVTQFHDGLSPDLQDLIVADLTYIPPNLSTLVTRSAQLTALCTLRVTAVRHYTFLRTQEKLIQRTLTRRLKTSALTATFTAGSTPASTRNSTPPDHSVPLPPPPVVIHPPLVDDGSAMTPAATRTYLSPAEQTIQRYQPTPVTATTELPVDPLTNFRSP
jgi:hypothetical protein